MTKRVLVVDDEIDTLNLLKTILEIHGFEPITTLNSIDAITLAEVEKADVALLDVMMPKLDGFALCKMMRAYPFTANMPIIFITAYTALDLEDRRKEAGADHVVQKPIDMQQLVNLIENSNDIRPALPPSRGKTGMLDESVLAALPARKDSTPPPPKPAEVSPYEVKPTTETKTTTSNGTAPKDTPPTS